MNKFFKMFGATGLLAGMLILGGCGEDAATPQGQVVKGPVNGAVVTGANGATFTTAANGKFPLFGGPYTATGGTYHDLATNTDKPAPVMRAQTNARNITVLTTLVNDNPTLKAKIESLGIKFDDALTTVTAGNKDAIALNEAVGVALASITTAGASTAEITSFITKIATELAATDPVTDEIAPTDIGNLVKDALTTTVFTTPAVIASVVTATTQITNTVTAVNNLPVGATLTGSTGSTGTTIK